MRKIFIVLTFIIIALFSIFNVEALTCSSSDNSRIISYAYKVKADYEVIDHSKVETLKIGDKSTTYIVPNFTFKISVYNINSNDIYIRITDSKEKVDELINESLSENGTFVIDDNNFNEIDTYKIEIFSGYGQCAGELIKTLTLIKPKYNVFSQYDYCKNSNVIYCKKFVKGDLSITSEQDFYKAINVTNNDSNVIKTKSFKESIRSNKKTFIYAGIVAAVLAIILILIITIKSRGDKL